MGFLFSNTLTYHHRFSMRFKPGDCDGHFRIFWAFFWSLGGLWSVYHWSCFTVGGQVLSSISLMLWGQSWCTSWDLMHGNIVRSIAVTRGFLFTYLFNLLAVDKFVSQTNPVNVASSFNFKFMNFTSYSIYRNTQCLCYVSVSFSLFLQSNDHLLFVQIS